MKLSTFRTLALGLSAIVAPVGLLAQSPIHATVPFSFAVGSKELPAGEYEMKRTSSTTVAIRSMDGKSVAMVLVSRSDTRATPGHAHLTFNRYGDHYFLWQIAQYDEGLEFPKSRIEKQIAAKQAAAKLVVSQPVELAASTKH